MPLEIVMNDITLMDVDAIVNAAHPTPTVGSGVDGAIHRKAGPGLLEARKAIGTIEQGTAVITPGFDLDAKYVIHTVSRYWDGGDNGEEEVLAACYRNSLMLAKQNKLKSVAFPLIAAGAYGYPKDEALRIANREIGSFLEKNNMQVYLVIYDRDDVMLPAGIDEDLRLFLDNFYTGEDDFYDKESGSYYSMPETLGTFPEPESDGGLPDTYEQISVSRSIPELGLKLGRPLIKGRSAGIKAKDEELDELLAKLDASWSVTLIQLIRKSGKKDVEVYTKANVDRKLFSKIRSRSDYRPTKPTAIAFAFALGLTLDETKEFIGRAGFALSTSSKFDTIVIYCLKQGIYDIYTVNTILFDYDQAMLGNAAA